MVRDFGIMFFQDFLLLVCVYLFLMPLHVMEKKKIKNGLILCGAWCVMLAARLLIPAIGEHLIAAISLFSPVFCGNVSAFVYHTVSLASKKWILPGRTKKNTLSSSSAFLILVFLLQFLPEPWRIQSCGSGSVILRDFFVSAGRAFQKKRSKAGVCADGAHVVQAEDAIRDRERPDAGDRPQMSRSEVSGGCNAAY